MLSVHRDTVHILHRMCKSGEVRRLACPLRRFPLGRPPELSGGKVVAQPPKGVPLFPRAAGAVVWFTITLTH